MSEEIRDELLSAFGHKLFETKIRRSVRLREAPAFGKTIFQHAPASSGAVDYLSLAQEVLARLSPVSLERPLLHIVNGVEASVVAHE